MNMYKVGPMVYISLGLSVFFLAGCAGGKKVSANTPKPVTAKTIDPNLPPEEKKIQLLAQQIELEKQLKETQKERDKLRTPAEKKATRILLKVEKKTRREQEEEERTETNAHITGCEAGAVTVNPKAIGNRSWQPYGKMLVVNTESVPITILSAELGWVVKGLCPGGSVILFRRRDPFLDGNTVQYNYKAVATFNDGALGTQESPYIYLSAYQAEYQIQQFVTWQVHLEKHIPQH